MRPKPLTGKELDVIKLLVSGLRRREVCATLNITPTCFTQRRERILSKLGAENDAQAGAIAYQRGYVALAEWPPSISARLAKASAECRSKAVGGSP